MTGTLQLCMPGRTWRCAGQQGLAFINRSSAIRTRPFNFPFQKQLQVNSSFIRTMATATKIQLSPSHHPVFYTSGMNEEIAKKASELLQENHEKYHIFFRAAGFHVSTPPGIIFFGLKWYN
jgi:hypothetical protein